SPRQRSPDPVRGASPPAPPLSEARKKKEKVAGSPSHCPPDSVPQTPSGELRPLHPLLRRRGKRKRRLLGIYSRAHGSFTVNTVCASDVLSTVISPSCARTIVWAIARPRPVPAGG